MNLEKDLISIIIPVYNVEKYLERCLLSLINQSYKNLEIILVNDGSKDSSGDICDKYSKLDNRIKVIHQENQGVSVARNNALDRANGDYIGFVDSDDFININMYKILHELINKHQCNLAICSFKRFDNENEINMDNLTNGEPEKFTDGKLNIDKLNDKYDYNILCNKLYKRNIFAKIRCPLNMSYAEDLFIMPDIYKTANEIIYTKDQLYYYYTNLSSASYSLNDEKLQSAITTMEKVYAFSIENNVNQRIIFDWYFGAIVRAVLTSNNKKFRKIYSEFYLNNILTTITEFKCNMFLILPKKLYVLLLKRIKK